MSVLNQYNALVGDGDVSVAHIAAGPKGGNDASSRSFGGFTYGAPNDGKVKNAFSEWTTIPAKRIGPLGDVAITNGSSDTTYGPYGRLSNNATTFLERIAKGIASDGGALKTWSTEGSGIAMAEMITSGTQMRSMKIRTFDGGNAMASGAPFVGYDDDNPYRITNWAGASGNFKKDYFDTDVPYQGRTEKTQGQSGIKFPGFFIFVDDVGETGATVNKDSDSEDFMAYEWLGVETGASETFGGTTDITTGLRGLPDMITTAQMDINEAIMSWQSESE